MTAVFFGPETRLPWSAALEDDRRFGRITLIAVAILLVVSIIFPWLPVEELTREKQEEIPPQLAQVILEKKELPKPPPPPPKPKVEEKPKDKPKPEQKEPKPVEPPKEQKVDVVQKAREKAAAAGLMAFQDDLADMRDSVDTSSLDNNLTRGDQTAAKVERSVISSGKTSAGSGGIKTAALSTQTGGAALSSHETTRVEAPVDTGQVAKGKGQSAAAGGRSDEAIRRVMDQNKTSIFSIYNRALRKNPGLQGKVVFEMVIEPNGTVSSIKLLSSELRDDDLTNKILTRIRLIRFPSESVVSTKVNYSFDFLPY